MNLPHLPPADLMTQAKYLKSLPEFSAVPLPMLLKQIAQSKESGLLLSTQNVNFGKIPALQKSVKYFYINMRRGLKYSPTFDVVPRGVQIELLQGENLLKVKVEICIQLGEFRGSITIKSPHEQKTVLVSAFGEASVENQLLECSINDLEATWRAQLEGTARSSQNELNQAIIEDYDDFEDFADSEQIDLNFVEEVQRSAMSEQEMQQRLIETQENVAKQFGLDVSQVQRQFHYTRRGSVEKIDESSTCSAEQSNSNDNSKRRWDGVEQYCGCQCEISVEQWFLGFALVLE